MKNNYFKKARLTTLLLICLFGSSLLDAQNPNARHNTQQNAENAQTSQQDPRQNSSDKSPFEAVKGLKEDSKKRDAYSKHYINDDGSFTALIGAGPIHYEKNGKFHDIEHRITHSFDANYPYANTTNLFESHFGATSHTGVKNKSAEGEIQEFLNTQMYWEVNGQAVNTLNSANKAIRIEGDKAYYDNIYGNISAEFITLTGKRKLNYVIPHRQGLGTVPAGADYLVFTEDVVLPFNWTSSITESGVMIKDQLGKEIYLYENPVSTDAESHALREENTIFETLQIGNTLTIKTKVKTAWLLSGERVFPVMVDPTTNVYPDNTTNWTRSVASDGYPYNDLQFGRDIGYFVRGFVKYNLTSIDTSAIINSAVGYIYVFGIEANSHNTNAFRFKNAIDPTANSGVSLYSSATTFYSPDQLTNQSTGWKNVTFNNNGQLQIGNSFGNYINLSVDPGGSWHDTSIYKIRNHIGGSDGTLKPYLSINYTEPITDRTLEVAGAGIGASHADGPYTFENNESVTLTSGTRIGYNIVGWTGTGSVPATGTGGSVTFTITANSTINWNWQQVGLPNNIVFHNVGGTEQLAFNNSRIDTTTPTFRLSHATDPATDYEIEINTSPTFTGGTPWTQIFTGTYPLSTEANFTFTNGFAPTNGTTYTYYVRARAKGEADVWSAWSTETYSFTYQSPQEIPDWFQTTQAQFQTDVLTGVTANASHNVVTSPGGNLVVNGDFTSGNTNGWTLTGNNSTGKVVAVYGNADASYPGNWLGIGTGNTVFQSANGTIVVSQAIDLTNVSQITFNGGAYHYASCCSNPSPNTKLEFKIGGTLTDTNGNIGATLTQGSNNRQDKTVNVTSYTGVQVIKFVMTYNSNWNGNGMARFYIDDVVANAPPVGTITSTPIHFASVQDATAYDTFKWNQTPGTGDLKFDIQGSLDGVNFSNITDYIDIGETGAGEKTHDISGIDPLLYPHLRLVGKLNGEGVTLHDWSVQFQRDDRCADATTWDGYKWSHGIPTDPNTKIIFDGDFVSDESNTASGELIGCVVEVKSGNVVIATGYNLTVNHEITVATDATFTLKDDANLVQINEENVVNTGNIKVERTFTFSSAREQYNFVNSPVVGLNITGIYPGTPLAQYYNEPNNKFIYYDGAYQAGRGVALSEPATGLATTVAEFIGVPFNGTLTMTGLSNARTGFQLIGNPYPSQLDLDLLYADNDEVLETRFLFWDNRGNTQITQYGDGYNGNHYAQYNALVETGTAAATGIGTGIYPAKVPNGKVAVGSAVMVRFLIDAPESGNSIVLNNTQRTTGESRNFFGRAVTQTEKDRYWLTMDTPGDLSVMNAVVYFEGGNNGFGMDDNTSAGGSDDFYTMVENRKLAIQGKASFEVSDTITVGYKAFERGAYKINLHQFEGVFAENIHIYLIDNETSTSHNLSEEGSYHFETEAGEFQNRFFIVYETEEVEEPEEPLANVEFGKSGLAVYKHANQTVILSNQQDLKELKIFNIQGQLLLNKKDISGKSYRFDNDRFGKQALVLVVKTADGKEHNFKVLTH